jgi:hypothetical protein
MLTSTLTHPLAITMWDFSWLERRWPGAGYEDWNEALDGLCERGYDAVRIDAYPHLVATDPGRIWELVPVWDQHLWGSPGRNRVRVQPELIQFIESCAERGIKVALSTWFRQDVDDIRMHIRTPADLGRVWVATLDAIRDAGLLDALLYVDLCNEFALSLWAPFTKSFPDSPDLVRASPDGTRWMAESIALVREAYPSLAYCFSITSEFDTWKEQDVSFMDLLEPHIWMVGWTDFYQQIGYHYERFEPTGYNNLARYGEKLYRENHAHWQAGLLHGIATCAEWSRATGKPLVTTECWGVIEYKDWPLLRWDWVKELCALGVQTASRSRRWAAIATSNFCGPQFVGMWRDIAWHRELTDIIHNGVLPGKDSITDRIGDS